VTLLDSDGKAAVIRSYAQRFPDHRVMVETGTACGDLPFLLSADFDRIVTIEADVTYWRAAKRRLAPFEHITVRRGDSADMLRLVVNRLAHAPCIFWLDAHEIIEDGHSALLAEMATLEAEPPHHVILVDDARLCTGRKGWPTIDQITTWASFAGYEFEGVEDDIVRMVP
jgi:hypothetical protein